MTNFNPSVIILLTLLFLNSCGTIKESMKKNNNSDEFLIKKKAPLVLPPDFDQLPEPGVSSDKDKIFNSEDEMSIEEIIRQNSSNSDSAETSLSNSSLEKSIIEKINKE